MKTTIAIPKGRILEELSPILKGSEIEPEADFYSENSRKLIFSSKNKKFNLIKVRSFDVATFVSIGAAQIGICGNDVLQEFNYENLYSPVDLKIGKCRLSIAGQKKAQNYNNQSHIRVATKYVNLTKNYFAKKAIQAECIKLNGSIELAPKLGICDLIVDLVSTGNTLKANNMSEIETILDVSSRLIVNKQAYKTMKKGINDIVEVFS